MKSLLLILSLTAAGAVGCAGKTQPAGPQDTTANRAATVIYEPSGASALAFDPPMASGQSLPSFDRAGRAPAAFAGYEEAVTTTAYTHQRDEIRVYGEYGRVERRAYYDRTSVTRR